MTLSDFRAMLSEYGVSSSMTRRYRVKQLAMMLANMEGE